MSRRPSRLDASTVAASTLTSPTLTAVSTRLVARPADELLLQAGRLALRLIQILDQRRELRLELVHRRADRPRQREQPLLLRPGVIERQLARQDFHPPDAAGKARLAQQEGRADLAGAVDVRAAAQLLAPAADVHHADLVAVLLAEDRHRAGLAGLVDLHDLPRHRLVRQDVVVHPRVDLFHLLAGDRARIVEVEAGNVRRHQRAALRRVLAEHVLERPMQDVGDGVVPRGRCAVRGVNFSDHLGVHRAAQPA